MAKDLRDLTTAGDDLVTSYEYNDVLLRPTAVVAPNGLRSETIYSDVPGNLWVKTRAQFDTNVWNEATVYADGLGRTLKTRTKDASGDVIVETKYDLMGRVSEVSNPYREGAAASNILWSKTVYDAAGRVETVYSPKPDGQTGDSIGTNEYGIVNEAGLTGVWQVSIDASGRKKRTVTNSLGQLARVDEATSFGGTIDADLGSLSAPHQATYYKYSIKGEMVEVTQGGQKRHFLYDSLGRLIRVKQPEQQVNASLNKTDPVTGNSGWTAGFKYNAAGNLVETTDAEGVKITNTYDNADRVLTRSYSDGITPTVNYKYDLVANGKGALIETSNSVSTSKTTQFDGFSRATQYQQITDGQSYTSKYKYNLSGALVEEEYPSGRIVKNDFDTNGDLSRVWGINGQVQQTFANSFNYTAAGGISAMRLGNGRWETAKFNERLQLTELGLGSSATDAGVWKVNYEYGEIDANGDLNTSQNTGHITRQTIGFNGLQSSLVQSFNYDALYRLKEAKEKVSSQTQINWSQNFTYDRYGNRLTHRKYINGNFIAQDNKTHPAIDTNTNRFLTSEGYEYDKKGNLTSDAENRTFTFNGDNKQIQVKNAYGVLVGTYFYDGAGKRVKKNVYLNRQLSETIVFVYSGGRLIAEYSTIPPPPQGKTKYLTEDHLGTPRIITDEVGNVIARRDFMAFGEDLHFGIGERSQAQNYSSNEDDVRQKFTGYQKDEETGLDFAEARMYADEHARFTAVDPLLASGKSANPQTFNRYVYAGNNPVNRTDSTGKDWEIEVCGKKCSKPVYVERARKGREWKDRIFVETSTGEIIVLHPTTREFYAGDRATANSLYEKWYGASKQAETPVGNDTVKALVGATNAGLNKKIPVVVGAGVTAVIIGTGGAAGLVVSGGSAAAATGGGMIGLGGISIAGGGYMGWYLSTTPGLSPGGGSGGGLSPGLSGQLADIYNTYPITDGGCQCASQEALQAFADNGITGNIIELRIGSPGNYLPNIVTADGKTLISDQGFHQAVQVGDRFYDALTGSEGATWDEYQKLFMTNEFRPLTINPPRPYIPPQEDEP